jgi:hypothetical protein
LKFTGDEKSTPGELLLRILGDHRDRFPSPPDWLMLLAVSTKTRNQMDIIPKIITQIHHNWVWSAANHNPLEGEVF